MDDSILNVEDIHLSYNFYVSQSLKTAFLRSSRKRFRAFEALKGISFSVMRGDNLGIIGSNGSGKSTLLRVLASTLTPDSGRIRNNASSVSLLSLGVGFNQELSGYENIYLNGLLLGLSKNDIVEKLADIVAFAELDEFIDNPVRTYSSGMKSRLSFSIAINIDPDLLLIDELFSVGDERFREKSHKKIDAMIKDHRTVVMVSHNLQAISKYCNRVIWLDEGRIVKIGDPEETIREYRDKTYRNIKPS